MFTEFPTSKNPSREKLKEIIFVYLVPTAKKTQRFSTAKTS
jgi:hypothetical protein